eukprot:755564-Hanusia_phi.AAC.2
MAMGMVAKAAGMAAAVIVIVAMAGVMRSKGGKLANEEELLQWTPHTGRLTEMARRDGKWSNEHFVSFSPLSRVMCV